MRILTLLLILILTPLAHAQVLPGIDVLAARNFDILSGKRVGLVTNQTGKTRDGRATIDVLRAARNVKLVALFAPEHGVRGEIKAGATVKTYRDRSTGLLVYSLYGDTKSPTRAMLRGVDVLVFDIQDIGSRSYTFIATMGECMKACAAYEIPYVDLGSAQPDWAAQRRQIGAEILLRFALSDSLSTRFNDGRIGQMAQRAARQHLQTCRL